MIRAVSGMPEEEFAGAFVRLLASGLVRVPGVNRRDALHLLDPDGAQSSVPGVVLTSSGESSRVVHESADVPLVDAATAGASDPPSPEEPEPARAASERPAAEAPVDTRRPPRAPRMREEFTTGNRAAVAKPKPKSAKLSPSLLPANWPVPYGQFTFDPVVMATGTALDDEAKKVILYYHYHLRRVTYYDLLGIVPSASRKEVKLAYFRLSKAFHPDRWYRQDTGEFGEMIEDVFKWLNRAYGVLSSPKKRKGYDKLTQRGYIGEWQLERGVQERPTRRVRPVTSPEPGPSSTAPAAGASASSAPSESVPDPSMAERSSEKSVKRTSNLLVARARRAESAGEWAEACDLYERVVQVDPTADLRIRLAECMLKANLDPHEIDRHISEARALGADEKSASLIEAEVSRRLGQLGRAERCYRAVLSAEPSNPVARLGLERLGASVDGTN